MGSVRALVVIEGDPAPDAIPCLRSGLPSVEMDAFILEGPPQALDEDVVDAAPFAVHRDPGANPFQPVSPGEGRELAALIRVHDLRWSEAVDGLGQRLDAEVGLQRVRDAPRQYLPGILVHDGDEIKDATPYWDVGDVGAPDLIGPLHAQPTQQIWVALMPLRRSASIGLLVDRHQAHQPPDAFVIHGMAPVLQVPSHLLHAAKRGFEELFVDLHLEV
jgi:hypothetical protein